LVFLIHTEGGKVFSPFRRRQYAFIPPEIWFAPTRTYGKKQPTIIQQFTFVTLSKY